MRLGRAAAARLRCVAFGAALARVMRSTQRLKIRLVVIVAALDVVDLISPRATERAGRVAVLAAVAVAPEHAVAPRAPVARESPSTVTRLPTHQRAARLRGAALPSTLRRERVVPSWGARRGVAVDRAARISDARSGTSGFTVKRR